MSIDPIEKTKDQYNAIRTECELVFSKKTTDYGTAWRILRPSSMTDQIYIKAKRIRTIQETGENRVGESIEDEFVAIINYSIMAILQDYLSKDDELKDILDLPADNAIKLYGATFKEAFELMLKKNHDYGEAWRDMRVSSITDLILQKVLRVKQIEDNSGKTIISEGINASYFDMINYSIFALIQSK